MNTNGPTDVTEIPKKLAEITAYHDGFPIPIYVLSKHNKLVQFGTRFIARRRNRTLMVTAGHCVKEITKFHRAQNYRGPIVIAFCGSTHTIEGPYTLKRTTDDKTNPAHTLDIAVLDISEDEILVSKLSVATTIDLDEVAEIKLSSESISVIGYPLKANKSPVR